MYDFEKTIGSLTLSLKNQVLVLDGAMGTSIQNLNLEADDFGGIDLEGCNENLVLTKPHLIKQIHKEFLEAGANIIETNTFGGTPLVLEEFGIGSKAVDINKRAVEIAKEAIREFEGKGPCFVAGSIGPTTKAISVTGGITFKELTENFKIQSRALIEAGADYLLIETAQDTRNVKSALIAIQELEMEWGVKIPVAVSGTIETMGTMLAGQTVEAFTASLENFDLLYLGLNCATGPEFMTDHIRSLSEISKFPIACVPNAGLPNEYGKYSETPKMMASVLKNFGEQGWLNLIGGCCGTTPEYIREFAQIAQNMKPRVATPKSVSYLSGIELLEVTDDKRPVIVGERTNVIGSRKFKKLICDEKIDEASEIARAQVKRGAQIIDVCVANPDRNEFEDMEVFLDDVIKKIKVPLMVDSTDAEVIEMALTYSQGKAIINSINLEDGEERFEQVVPIAKKYGAALVVGTIDEDPEQGMGVSKERKLEIAKRSYNLLTKKYGFAEKDIYFDPLVFPCATGDEQYVGSAVETIEGVRLIKENFPNCKTVLGISNVSFGLPTAGREILNSVFLYHCVQSGLDLALVNSQGIVRYASISEEEKELADNLLFNRGEDPIADFAAAFRDKKARSKDSSTNKNLPIDERLANYIIEGIKDGLIDDLNEKLKSMKPMDIINGPLMKGMDEVGRLFNKNELIVAEVLQSAEAMKTAVAHLESFMEKSESQSRGKMLIATVKGDVHDIGKNLVDIILSNNGFEVVNLGIKIPPETLINAIREHKPDFVGLSGLLVKSAQQMTVTAKDLRTAGIQIPILVGGAALSRNYVDRTISPEYEGLVEYAGDAMHGLELAKKIMSAEMRSELESNITKRRSELKEKSKTEVSNQVQVPDRSPELEIVRDIPQPEKYIRVVETHIPLDVIWRYVNPIMLYNRHLGIKPKYVKAWMNKDKTVFRESDEAEKALNMIELVNSFKDQFKDALSPRAIYQFFRAHSEGDKLHIFRGTNGSTAHSASFEFPRQKKGKYLCLSDYVSPNLSDYDNIGMFVTTVGKDIRNVAQEFKDKGEYLKSHAIQVLAFECAEGYAEYLHSKIRKLWGFPDSPNMTMMDRFQAKYKGKRYSFGYPACPNLEDQSKLFELINPEEIGVSLTEEFMMDPEASVSAIVFHHPQATYYSVGNPLEEVSMR